MFGFEDISCCVGLPEYDILSQNFDMNINLYLCHKNGRHIQLFEKMSLFPDDCYIINEKYLFNDKQYYLDIPLFFNSITMSDNMTGDIIGNPSFFVSVGYYSFEKKYGFAILSENNIILKKICQIIGNYYVHVFFI